MRLLKFNNIFNMLDSRFAGILGRYDKYCRFFSYKIVHALTILFFHLLGDVVCCHTYL